MEVTSSRKSKVATQRSKVCWSHFNCEWSETRPANQRRNYEHAKASRSGWSSQISWYDTILNKVCANFVRFCTTTQSLLNKDTKGHWHMEQKMALKDSISSQRNQRLCNVMPPVQGWEVYFCKKDNQ